MSHAPALPGDFGSRFMAGAALGVTATAQIMRRAKALQLAGNAEVGNDRVFGMTKKARHCHISRSGRCMSFTLMGRGFPSALFSLPKYVARCWRH